MMFRQFLTFATVGKHGNVSKAAQELHTSQPAVTRQLHLLQLAYKTQLYERTGRGIRLTEAGSLFLKDINTILRQVERLETRLKGFAAPARKITSLKIGGGHNVSTHLLPLLLAQFRKSHPDVELDLKSHPSRVIENLVARGKLEIGLITHPARISDVALEPFRKRSLVAVVCAQNPLARKKAITVSDLAQLPLVIRGAHEAKNNRTIFSLIERHGWKPNVIMHCDSSEAVRTAVRETMGVGFLYEDLVKVAGHEDFKTLKLTGVRLGTQIFIAYPKDKALSPPAQDFLLLLRQWRDGTMNAGKRSPSEQLTGYMI